MTFAYLFDYKGFDTRIAPTQIPSEIEALLRRVRALRPRTVLEIGTYQGGTLFLLATIADDDALLLSVDLPQGRFGGGYTRRRRKLYRSFSRSRQRIELLQRDSHDRETQETVERMVAARGVDVLLIDGDHSYDGVKSDFLAYSRLVRSGGLIIFHDIVPGPEENVGGVPQFWKELKASGPVEEIVEDWDQGGFGLGLLVWA